LGVNVEEWEQDSVANITCTRQSSLGRKTGLENIFNKKVAGTCFLPRGELLQVLRIMVISMISRQQVFWGERDKPDHMLGRTIEEIQKGKGSLDCIASNFQLRRRT
jgi:hypothetical protein